MVAAAAERPDGTITGTFRDAAVRQSAYRRLADDTTTVAWLASAVHSATARACADKPFVFVPMDGSSLNITDTTRSKGTGSIGARNMGACGFLVLSAMAVSDEGVPMGMVGQRWSARGPRVGRHRHGRRLEDKETRFWTEQMKDTAATFAAGGGQCRPWFQMDRGADAGDVLEYAVDTGLLVTVRAEYNRRVRSRSGITYLRSTLKRQASLGSYELDVPARSDCPARTAVLAVRTKKISLDLRNRWTKKHWPVEIGVVMVSEVGPRPPNANKLEWLLYTTAPTGTLQDARCVIRGYAARWSIEELHRTWKSGLCDVEKTQLHTAERMQKWATVLASVAVRAQRLKHQSRKTPDAPATDEFDEYEIEATFLLREEQGYCHDGRRSTPTLWQLVDWIARLGGYTGKSSGGPPGQIVISRGLADVEAAARVLRALGRTKK